MKKGKKILSILLSMILVLGLVPADGAEFVLEKMGAWIEVQAAATASTSGTCGDNLTWELSEDGVLTISGTGEMDDWNSSANFGWSSMRNQIKKVVINDGVTNIPSYAFYLCVNLAEISIPDGITSVGNYAFGNCTILKEIDLPDSVVSIGRSAFAGCDNLREISIPARVTDISQYAFAGCDKLASVGIPDGVVSINSYAFSVCKGLTNIYYEGSEEDWIQIDIDDQGNTYLLDAIIHYNSLLPKEGFYAIQIAPDIEFGSISVINSSEKGNEVTVNVYPDEGYILKKLTIETENGEKIIALNQSENIYTFTMPDSNVTISAQFQSTAFYFGELLSYKNVEYALVGDTITLYGVIHNEEENFDIDSAIESVDWEFSDEESLELV